MAPKVAVCIQNELESKDDRARSHHSEPYGRGIVGMQLGISFSWGAGHQLGDGANVRGETTHLYRNTYQSVLRWSKIRPDRL